MGPMRLMGPTGGACLPRGCRTAVQNVRGGCPKWFGCSAVRLGRGCLPRMRDAWRVSRISEWLPEMGRMRRLGSMGRMGNENGYAQRHSKVSECLSKMSKSVVSVLSVDGCLPQIRDAGLMSKMRVTGVQNGEEREKWKARKARKVKSWKPECTKL